MYESNVTTLIRINVVALNISRTVIFLELSIPNEPSDKSHYKITFTHGHTKAIFYTLQAF